MRRSLSASLGALIILGACATSGTRADGSNCNNQYDCGEEAWFESRVTTEDDPMEPYIRHHTDRTRIAYFPDSILGGIKHDFYFDVRVNRKTGSEMILVRGYLENDRDWARPSNIYFPELDTYIDLELGNYDVDCSGTSCDHLESFVGLVPPAFVRQFLDFYSLPYSTAEVRFNSGVDVDRTIRASELRAVLKSAGVLERYTADQQ